MKLIALALLASLLYAFLGAVAVLFVDCGSAWMSGKSCPELPWVVLAAGVAFGMSTLVQLFVSLAFVPLQRTLSWRRLLLTAAAIAVVNLLFSAGLMVLTEALAPDGVDKPVTSVLLSSALSCIAVLGWIRWRQNRSAFAATDPTMS